MIQLNLLPDVKKEFLQAQRTKATVIGFSILVTLGAVGLTVFLFLTVYVGQPLLIAGKQGEIDTRTKDLKAVEDIGKYLTIQNQLIALPELYDEKVIYSRLFEYLKVLNPAPPNNVRLSSLQTDQENKEIVFNGVAGNFQAFTIFRDTLVNAELTYKQDGEEKTGKLFATAVIESQNLTRNQGRQELGFIVRATYNEFAFNPNIEEVKLNIPNIQTTQSITGAPSRANALFDENADPGVDEGGD
ncbi:MAG TPA: hypothetical protein VFZ58_03845 [Candidatus Saccharimonadales bacterium]